MRGRHVRGLSDEDDYERLYERHESTGQPLGPKRLVVMLEKALARVLQPRQRGRKPLRRAYSYNVSVIIALAM